MECPTCRETLQISERQGIEIDYCPKCRGIWLDRGELDKLIERSISQELSAKRHRDSDSDYPRNTMNERFSDADYRDGKPKKKESWLSRMLDFD